MRWLLAPTSASSNQDFIDCAYDVMDVQVADDDLPNFVPLASLQCPVKMTARQRRDLTTRRQRWIRTDYKKNLDAVQHCIQRFTGELMSESDDEIPFTASQKAAAKATGVLPSADEVRLQKQQLEIAEENDV